MKDRERVVCSDCGFEWETTTDDGCPLCNDYGNEGCLVGALIFALAIAWVAC